MQIRKDVLKDAAYDLRFLLNRCYRKKGALNFVSNKYVLSTCERNYLARAVHSNSISASRMDKIVNLSKIKDQSLFIDGYNVLISYESIISGNYESIILCDDGVIRDLNAVFGRYKCNKMTANSLNSILSLINEYKPLNTTFLFDKQVSFSGKLANFTRKILKIYGLKGEVILSKNVDFDIVKLENARNGIVATSDGIIIDKVNRIIDLPFYFLKKSKISIKRSF